MGITIDANGSLFGTAELGGAASDGTVWELAKGANTVTVIHTFTNGPDGANPWAITIDTAGNLYGTSINGGVSNGVVWELPRGSSTATMLYNFNGTVFDGVTPEGITIDGGRNLFGTATVGGANGAGTIWELPYLSGIASALYSFVTPDVPAGIVFSPNGFVFGVAEKGGANNLGYVFNIVPTVDPAVRLAFVQQPTNGFDGIAIAPSVMVAVLDDNGNVVTTDSSTITLTLASGPMGGSISIDRGQRGGDLQQYRCE